MDNNFETPPYAAAKKLAVDTWSRREKWCEEAVRFWTQEYSDIGDTDANAARRAMMEMLSKTSGAVRKYKDAQIVGGRWLHLVSLPKPT
jgi:hypothetical protein